MAAVPEFTNLGESVADAGDGDLVQTGSVFFSVPGDERHGSAVV